MINILDKPYIKNLNIRLESENKYILLNMYGKVIQVNEIGKELLQLSNGLRTIEEISYLIAKSYDAELNVVLNDTIKFFYEMDICKVLQFNGVSDVRN